MAEPAIGLSLAPAVWLDELTGREREILELIATGLSNEGIAQTLVISWRTVEFHLRQIYLKLGLTSDPLQNQRVRAAAAWWGMAA